MKPVMPASLRDWQTEAFAATLCNELLALGKDGIPLHGGTRQGGYVDDADLEVSLLQARDLGVVIETRISCYFTEIVINCGCGVEPMPVPAYCEISVCIDKASGEASFEVLQD